jgi:hypothetical protein
MRRSLTLSIRLVGVPYQLRTHLLPVKFQGFLVPALLQQHLHDESAFSLGIAGQVLTFRTKARMRVTPPPHRTPHGQ